ncbi:hypothetical protein ACR6C2_16930 [Streptomyces sp. INA 01156]
MARKVVTTLLCDACAKKGLEDVSATVELKIADDEYHLCEEHGERFRGMLRDALGVTTVTAQSA